MPRLSGRAPTAAAMAALALGGCVSLPSPAPVDLFVLDPRIDGQAAAGDGPPIFVSAPRSGPGMDGPRIAYARRPGEIRYFARSQWVEAPAQMLGRSMVRALERTGRFQAVSGFSAGSGRGLRLESEVVRLQQEFMERPSRVRLTLRLELSDVAARGILGTREIEVVEVAPSDDAAGGVAAASAAARRALAEAAEWCSTVAERPRPPGGSGPPTSH